MTNPEKEIETIKRVQKEIKENQEFYDALAKGEEPSPKEDEDGVFIWKLTYPDGHVSFFHYGGDVAGQAERNDAELSIVYCDDYERRGLWSER